MHLSVKNVCLMWSVYPCTTSTHATVAGKRERYCARACRIRGTREETSKRDPTLTKTRQRDERAETALTQYTQGALDRGQPHLQRPQRSRIPELLRAGLDPPRHDDVLSASAVRFPIQILTLASRGVALRLLSPFLSPSQPPRPLVLYPTRLPRARFSLQLDDHASGTRN